MRAAVVVFSLLVLLARFAFSNCEVIDDNVEDLKQKIETLKFRLQLLHNLVKSQCPDYKIDLKLNRREVTESEKLKVDFEIVTLHFGKLNDAYQKCTSDFLNGDKTTKQVTITKSTMKEPTTTMPATTLPTTTTPTTAMPTTATPTTAIPTTTIPTTTMPTTTMPTTTMPTTATSITATPNQATPTTAIPTTTMPTTTMPTTTMPTTATSTTATPKPATSITAIPTTAIPTTIKPTTFTPATTKPTTTLQMTTTEPTTVMSPERQYCQTAKILTDSWRLDHNGSNIQPRDPLVNDGYACDFLEPSSWFRFSGSAGTSLLNECPKPNSCGAKFPYWSADRLPKRIEQIGIIYAHRVGPAGCQDASVKLHAIRCSYEAKGDVIYKYISGYDSAGFCADAFCGMVV